MLGLFPTEGWVEPVVSILQVLEGSKGYCSCRKGTGMRKEESTMGKRVT